MTYSDFVELALLRGRYDPVRPAPAPAPAVDSPYLTVEEAAAYCRVAVRTIYNSRSTTGYPVRMPGVRKLVFTREALDEWLATRR